MATEVANDPASSTPEQPPRDQRADEGEVYSIYQGKAKILIVLTASIAGFFSPLSANIYLPALNTLADQLHVSNTLINLTVTTYMIFQGLAPAIFGGFADSAGSSSTVALANAIVADVVTTAERGVYIGYASAGGILGPSLGPIIGGLLTQFLGWPSIFWFLTIFAGAFFVPLLLFLPETARRIVGNGSRPPPRWNQSLLQLCSRHRSGETPVQARVHFPNPLKTLVIVFDREVFLILACNSLIFSSYYAVSTSVTSQFKMIYGFNDVQIGLCFIPVGVGSLLAAYTQGRMVDWNYARYARQQGITVSKTRRQDLTTFPIERARTEVVFPLIVLEGLGMIAYGWVLHYQTNLSSPLILLFIIGYTSSATFNILSVLMVDIYQESPATATAANNLTRCWLGAAFTAFILPMIDAIGRGWAFTIIGIICFLCVPVLLAVWQWGYGWRQQRQRREEEKQLLRT
ncbi:hypothetical protein DTO271D3_5780 [Paecilomyces variotii]|nr:hypothetical protein DTO271D3_5780 [Paecilomyces variotii]